MIEQEKLRVSSLHVALAKGEADIQVGRTIAYTPNLMADISKEGKEAALAGKPVKSDVKP